MPRATGCSYNSHMVVGIREFKNRATELVRRVESGKGKVTITRHSRPVAELVPLKKAKEESVEELRARLAAQGIIRPGDGKGFSNTPPIKGSGKPGSQIIIEEREDRF